MARIYGYDRNYYTVTMDVHEFETSTSGNWSKVGITLWIASKNASYSTSSSTPAYKLWVDGELWKGKLPSSLSSNSTKTFFTANKIIYHNGDGSKSINFSFNISGGGSSSYIPRDMSASGSLTLTKIPRYTTINDFRWNGQQSETMIGFHWATADTVDQISYRVDTNAWNTSNVNGTSGDFTISGLTAGKQYNFELSVKRKDSGLWTYKTIRANTYDYPHPTKNPDFTIGDALTLEFFNPLKRNVTINFYVEMKKVHTITTTGTTMAPYNDETFKDIFYRELGATNKQKRYWFEVIYGSSVRQSSYANMYAKESDCKPVIGSVDTYDNNSQVSSVVGDNSIIVQNLSRPRFEIKHIDSRRYATLKSIELSYDGVTITTVLSGSSLERFIKDYTTSKNKELYIKVTDSRGFVTSYTKTIDFTFYNPPVLKLSAERGKYDSVFQTWKSDEINGTWVKLSLSGSSIDSRLSIDTSKSKISCNSVDTIISNLESYYLGNGQLKTTSGYEIKVTLTDTLGRSYEGSLTVSSGRHILSIINDEGVGVGTQAEKGKFKIENLKLDTGYNEILTKMYELIYQLNSISPDVQNISNQLENLIESHTSTSKDLTFYDENWLPNTYVRYTTRSVTQKKGSDYWWISGLPKDTVYGRSRFITVNIIGNNGETFVTKIEYSDTGANIYLRNYGESVNITLQVACIYTKAIVFNQ